MKVMEAIRKGFGIAGKNFGVLAVLFIFNVIWNLATIPFLGKVTDLASLQLNAQMIILGVVFMLVNIFIQGGVFGVLKDAISSDGKAALGNFAKYGRKFYLKFLGLGALIILMLALGVLIIGLILSIQLAVKNIVVNIISTSIAIVLGAIGLYYLFLIFLSPYTLVMDDVGIVKAMGNSVKFVRSRIGKVTGLLTVLILVGLGIGFVVGILMGLLSLAFKLKDVAFQIVTGIISSGVNSYLTVIISAALMIYYSAQSGTTRSKQTEVSA